MDNKELWEKLSELSTQVATLRKEMELRFDSVAPRGWVHDVLDPIKQSISKIENAIASQSATVGDLAEKMKMMFESHDAFLKEKAESEREQLKSQTWSGLIKKYAPVVLFILSLFTLFGVLRVWIESLMKAVPR